MVGAGLRKGALRRRCCRIAEGRTVEQARATRRRGVGRVREARPEFLQPAARSDQHAAPGRLMPESVRRSAPRLGALEIRAESAPSGRVVPTRRQPEDCAGVPRMTSTASEADPKGRVRERKDAVVFRNGRFRRRQGDGRRVPRGALSEAL